MRSAGGADEVRGGTGGGAGHVALQLGLALGYGARTCVRNASTARRAVRQLGMGVRGLWWGRGWGEGEKGG